MQRSFISIPRRLPPLLAVLAASAFIVACDDDGNGGGANPPPTATSPASQPTQTPTQADPQATATPTSPAGATATATATTGSGSNVTLAQAEAIVSGVLPSIINLSNFGSLAGGTTATARQIGGFPVPCPAGGTLMFSCSGISGGSRTEISFNQCRIGASGTPETLIDGDFAQTTPAACFTPLPPNPQIGIDYDGSISTVLDGQPFAVDFDIAMQLMRQTDGTSRLDFDGTVNESCVGTVAFDTVETIVVPSGATCPTAGRIRFDLAQGSVETVHAGSGGVQIDLDANGSSDGSLDSCEDGSSQGC